MQGFLVINHFLKGEKFEALHNHLTEAAEEANIRLTVKTNQEMLFYEDTPDFVLFWDKDTALAKRLENRGLSVFNSARSIALCDDKAQTYLALEGIVPQPQTLIAPLSFGGADYRVFAEQAAQVLGLPLVFKECCGSFGEQVWLCHNVDDILQHVSDKPFLLQAFIAEAAGEDVRIEVVGGEVVAAMKRVNENDFRANVTGGGIALPYEPTQEESALALSACKALGLTFGGVDILNGNMVCEVNSNAHILNLLNCTGIDVAPLIFEEIKKQCQSR